MANSSLPELTLITSPSVSNYTYLAKDNGVDWYNDAKISLGTIKTFCSTSSTIEKTSDYVIDPTECDSQWFSNKGTADYLIFTLPLAVEGYEVGFVNESATYWIELKPNINDVIIPLRIVAGESIYGLNYGSTVYLRAIQDGWSVVYRYGTWNDTGSSSSSSSGSSSSSSCSCSSSSSCSCSCSSSSSSSPSSSSLSSSSSSLSSSSLSSSSSSLSSSSSSLSSSSSSSSCSCSSSSSSNSSSSYSLSSSSSPSSSSSQDPTNGVYGVGIIY